MATFCEMTGKWLWLPVLWYSGIVLNVASLSKGSNCSIYGEDGGVRTCTKKCCGLWNLAVCSDSCVGFSCYRDGECDDGCCQEGRCQASSCLPSRLIIAVTTTAIITFALFTLVILLWCWLQKRRKLLTRNIPRPRGHYVDMDEPYWRVRSFDPRIKLVEVGRNGNVNNGFHNHELNSSTTVTAGEGMGC